MKKYFLYLIILATVILLLSSSGSGLSSPTKSGKKRDCDGHGCGHYGAPRGTRIHKGVDYLCVPGEDVYSPIDGFVKRYAYPYSDDLRFEGVEIIGKGVHSGFSCKIFYVSPSVYVGSDISKGGKVGVCQDLSLKYPGISSHIHLEVYRDGVNVNPSSYI